MARPRREYVLAVGLLAAYSLSIGLRTLVFRQPPERVPHAASPCLVSAVRGDFSTKRQVASRPRARNSRAGVRTSSPEEELERLQAQVQNKTAHPGMFGVVMTKCGKRLWWDTLLAVYQLQKSSGVEMQVQGQVIFLSALASSLRDRKLSSEEMRARKSEALRLARDIWAAPLTRQRTHEEYSYMLGATWTLCKALNSEDATSWAIALLEWVTSNNMQINSIAYCPVLALGERAQMHEQVDAALAMLMRQQGDMVDESVLRQLVVVAGEMHNWKRLDKLWDVFTSSSTPGFLTYSLYASAHFRCGRPLSAIRILDELLEQDIGTVVQRAGSKVLYLQALLVLCHSTASSADLQRLAKFLETAPPDANVPNTKLEQWGFLKFQAKKLLRDPSAVAFSQLQRVMDERSVMKTWPDRPAGSKYLQSEEAGSEKLPSLSPA